MLIKNDKDIIQSYFEDHSGLLGGFADNVYIPANADEIDMDAEDFLELRRQNMSKGGLVKKGKPKRAKKGWK